MSYAGKNLRYLRRLRGWTQEEFANKLKIKRSLVGAYEEERAEPRLEVLRTICHIFKLSLDDLFLKDLTETKATTYLDKRRVMKTSDDLEVRQIQFVPVKSCGWLFNRLCRSGIYRRAEYFYSANACAGAISCLRNSRRQHAANAKWQRNCWRKNRRPGRSEKQPGLYCNLAQQWYCLQKD